MEQKPFSGTHPLDMILMQKHSLHSRNMNQRQKRREKQKMKKVISILLAIMMLGAFACAASADEVPQPEAGKKFESNWAIPGGLAEIDYEEEGYRVMLEITKDDGTGSR